MLPATASRLDLIPPPSAIHERLCEIARERAILRRLFLVAVSAERERKARKEATAQDDREGRHDAP
jgi:hypothetical protein